MIVGSVVLALVSFVVQGLLLAAEQVITARIHFAQGLADWIGWGRIIPALVMYAALYILFYAVTPSKYRLSGCPKWPGAAFTAGWWIGATALLPAALTRLGGYSLTYGSLAGVVVKLLIFWVVGIGLVFGAHLNAALAEPPGAGLEAPSTAERRAA